MFISEGKFAYCIGWENPELNKQVNHLVCILSVFDIFLIHLFVYLVKFFFTYVYFVSLFLHGFMSPLIVFNYTFYVNNFLDIPFAYPFL